MLQLFPNLFTQQHILYSISSFSGSASKDTLVHSEIHGLILCVIKSDSQQYTYRLCFLNTLQCNLYYPLIVIFIYCNLIFLTVIKPVGVGRHIPDNYLVKTCANREETSKVSGRFNAKKINIIFLLKKKI